MAKKKQTPEPRESKVRLVVLLGTLALLLLVAWIMRPTIFNSMASAALTRRDLQTAESWIERSMGVSSRDGQTHLLMARLQRRQGKTADAMHSLKKAKQWGVSQEDIDLQQTLIMAQRGMMSQAEPALPQLMSRVDRDGQDIFEAFTIGYLKLHRMKEATSMLQMWKEYDPQDPDPYVFQGILSQDVGEWQQSFDHYRTAIEHGSLKSMAYIGASECLIAMKKPRDAIDYLKQAAQFEDQRSLALCKQAYCHRILGETKLAQQRIEEALAIDAAQVDTNVEAAQIASANGDFQSAHQALEPLAKAHPTNLDLQYAYGIAMRGIGKTEEARKILNFVKTARSEMSRANQMAFTVKVEDVKTRFEIGSIHLQYGKAAEAIWWLHSVLEHEPKHQATHRILAEHYREVGDQRNEQYHSQFLTSEDPQKDSE